MALAFQPCQRVWGCMYLPLPSSTEPMTYMSGASSTPASSHSSLAVSSRAEIVFARSSLKGMSRLPFFVLGSFS